MQYWYKDELIDKWNETESPDIELLMYEQLNYEKADTAELWDKDNF